MQTLNEIYYVYISPNMPFFYEDLEFPKTRYFRKEFNVYDDSDFSSD